MNKFQLDDPINVLTHRIIGSAMEVHRTLGNGFQEVIYQRALAIEFRVERIEFSSEQEMESPAGMNQLVLVALTFLSKRKSWLN